MQAYTVFTLLLYRHRHVGIAMYYHSISIVESLRDPNLDAAIREKYTRQLYKNEKKLNDLATYSEVNYRMYHKIVVTYRQPPLFFC